MPDRLSSSKNLTLGIYPKITSCSQDSTFRAVRASRFENVKNVSPTGRTQGSPLRKNMFCRGEPCVRPTCRGFTYGQFLRIRLFTRILMKYTPQKNRMVVGAQHAAPLQVNCNLAQLNQTS
jgi:hypothetical protein